MRLVVVASFACCAQVGGQECEQTPTGGCSALAADSFELAPNLWICGNTQTTSSWESLWTMCNGCAGFYLPTRSTFFDAYSTPVQVRSLAENWALWTSAGARVGYGYVMTGQPAGSYGHGGWNALANADSGLISSVSLGQMSMTKGITENSWRAMSRSTDLTNNQEGDSGYTYHTKPTQELAATGLYWASLCLNGTDIHGSYVWHQTWRKRLCTSGLTLPNSAGPCPDNHVVGEDCDYLCMEGYHVQFEDGAPKHTCTEDATGTWGHFAGGKCVPDVCTGGFTIDGSPTVCSGAPDDVCEYTCGGAFYDSRAARPLPSCYLQRSCLLRWRLLFWGPTTNRQHPW